MQKLFKDIENVCERMARLEHYLRYALANKRLPEDERRAGHDFGEPGKRTGDRIPKSHHERYDIYNKMNIELQCIMS